MPAPRISSDEQLELAIDDLVRLGTRLPRLDVVPTGADRVDFHPRGDGKGWSAKVLAYDAVGEAQVKQLVATDARGRKVVVANRISEAARDKLTAAGWSWVDRRIGAHLAAPGRDVEVLFPTDDRPAAGAPGDRQLRPAAPAADGPISGRAGIAYAAALLCTPDDPPSLRSVARAVGMSPTAVGNAVQRLADAGLVGPGNAPTLPDLFWTLAEVWGPTRAVPVAREPAPHDPAIRPNVGALDEPGWVLGGDLAAGELGAPLFSPERRPWLWLPTQAELRRAERQYGPAAWADRAAVIAVPATPLVCRWRRPPRADGTGWPLLHPVFAALDLARDPGRGREVLERWTPEGADAVWR